MDWLMKLGIFSVQNLIKLGVLIGTLATAWANFNHRIDNIEDMSQANKDAILDIKDTSSRENNRVLNLVCGMAVKSKLDENTILENCRR